MHSEPSIYMCLALLDVYRSKGEEWRVYMVFQFRGVSGNYLLTGRKLGVFLGI